MKFKTFVLLTLLLVACHTAPKEDMKLVTIDEIPGISGTGLIFAKGGDVSFIEEIEDSGFIFYEDSVAKDFFEIVRNNGWNYVRLRLWNEPERGYCDLESTMRLAKRIKDQDMNFLLNFHYSDWWADPGKQNKPAAWVDMSYDELVDALYEFTKHSVASLKEQGTLPEMVQIGNEITPGMLYPTGKVGGEYDTPEQWAKFAGLIKAGVRGVRDSIDETVNVKIMIHSDRGGDNKGARWFFDNLNAQDVAFDVIGLSFYPWWHGTIEEFTANMADLALRYEKDIILAETAYPWTLAWGDSMHNIFGDSADVVEGYPATPEGQHRFLSDIIDIIRATPGDRGKGVIWWAPEYVSIPGRGSPWENLTQFDFGGNALKSLSAYKK